MPSLPGGDGRVFLAISMWRWECAICGMSGSAEQPNDAEDGLATHLDVVHPD